MTLVPAVLVTTFTPQLAAGAGVFAASALFMACLDAWRGAGRLNGLEASIPGVTRLFCQRPGRVSVTLCYPDGLRGAALRIALDMSEDAGSASEAIDCRLPRDAAQAELGWPCVPRCRGLFPVRLIACEAPSPWGLWHAVQRKPLLGELRVYPDLRQERRKVPALFLKRGDMGMHVHRAAGKGREFEKLREYVAGDDLGDIHWKASARRRFPVTKVFQIERTQEAYVVLDVSRLSGRPLDDTGTGSVLEQYLRTALTLVLAAERMGDRCGLIVFHRTVTHFLPAGNGRRHFDACRNALYASVTEPVSPDFPDLFAFIRARIPKRSLLLFLTHLDSSALADAFLEGSRLVFRKHVLAVPLLTPRVVRPAFSGAEPADEDALWRELAGHLQWRQLRELEQRLRSCGMCSALAAATDATSALMAHYLTVKERQLL